MERVGFALLLLCFCQVSFSQSKQVSVVHLGNNTKISNTAVSKGKDGVAAAGVIAVVSSSGKGKVKKTQSNSNTRVTKTDVTVVDGATITSVATGNNKKACAGVLCILLEE